MKTKIALLKLISSSVILTSSLSALAAAPICSEIFGSEVRFTKMDKDLTDKEIAPFRKVVNDLNNSLGTMLTPQNAELLIYKSSENPAANPLAMTVNVGVRYVRIERKLSENLGEARPGDKGKAYYKAPSFSIPILAHEYGHLIFMENYKKTEPLWAKAVQGLGDLQTLRNRSGELMKEIWVIQDQMIKQGQTVDPAISAKRTALMEELQQIEKKSDEINAFVTPIWNINTPYNEFFADVVAVLYTGKYDSISKGIEFAQELQAPDKAQRDYMKKSIAQRDFKNHIEHGADMEAHNYLSISRDSIWDSYLYSPTYRTAKRTEILDAVYEAVTSENSYMYQHQDLFAGENMAKNWKMINARLDAAIEKAMSARGIQRLK